MKQGFFSILEEIKKEGSAGGKTGKKCSIELFNDSLSKEEQKEFESILNNKDISRSAIIKVLKSNGVLLSQSQLYKHSNKLCACFNGK